MKENIFEELIFEGNDDLKLFIEISEPTWECGQIKDGIVLRQGPKEGGFVLSLGQLKGIIERIENCGK